MNARVKCMFVCVFACVARRFYECTSFIIVRPVFIDQLVLFNTVKTSVIFYSGSVELLLLQVFTV